MVHTAKKSWNTESRHIPPPPPPTKKSTSCCGPWLWGLLGLLALAGLITGLILGSRSGSSSATSVSSTPISSVNGTSSVGPIIPVRPTTVNGTGVVAPINVTGTPVTQVVPPVTPAAPIQPVAPVINYVAPILANTTLATGVTTPTVRPIAASIDPTLVVQTVQPVNIRPTTVTPMSTGLVPVNST